MGTALPSREALPDSLRGGAAGKFLRYVTMTAAILWLWPGQIAL
ncbi:MAG: hypothetical protein ACK4XK_08015 [Casimicrobiaceae bacterium]